MPKSLPDSFHVFYHKGLTLDKWNSLSFLLRMANIGSEVSRALSARSKSLENDAELAFLRSLELFDFTVYSETTAPQLHELLRIRELWVDAFKYDNIYKSEPEFFINYFNYLTVRGRLAKHS